MSDSQPRLCSDDPTIVGSERLWRRIQPRQLKRDAGTVRASSEAFRDNTDEMSVHLASLTSVKLVLKNYPNFSVAELTTEFVRSLGLNVMRDPLPEDPSHALVCPCATKGGAKQLAKMAALVATPSPG